MASPTTEAAAGEPRSRARLIGRIAAVFYLGSGLLTIVTAPLPTTGHPNVAALIVVGIVAVVVGTVSWFLPWDRWSVRATLWLVPIALVLIGVGNVVGDGDPYTYGIFFVLVFVWLGVGHPQWTSAAFAVPTAIAYVVPLLVGDVGSAAFASALVTIPVGVLVGESVAFLNDRLRTTEAALRASERRYAEAYEREHEAAEQLRSIDELKNAFLQAVSHELRTPLSVVLGGTLTLRERSAHLTEEDRAEIVEKVALKARKLDALVADLLDVDRLARGVLEPKLQPVELAELAARVVEGLDPLPDHPLVVETEPVLALADAAKLERILENLLANAARHTPPGTRVWLRTRSEDGQAVLAVEDAGPGVPRELRRRVFEPFGQGDRIEHAPGLGIGLALVARFADLMGGTASVEEREGGGASFRVRLPLAHRGDLTARGAAASSWGRAP